MLETVRLVGFHYTSIQFCHVSAWHGCVNSVFCSAHLE